MLGRPPEMYLTRALRTSDSMRRNSGSPRDLKISEMKLLLFQEIHMRLWFQIILRLVRFKSQNNINDNSAQTQFLQHQKNQHQMFTTPQQRHVF